MKIYKLTSFDTWGEYDYHHGYFVSEWDALQAAAFLELDAKDRDDFQFGWSIGPGGELGDVFNTAGYKVGEIV